MCVSGSNFEIKISKFFFLDNPESRIRVEHILNVTIKRESRTACRVLIEVPLDLTVEEERTENNVIITPEDQNDDDDDHHNDDDDHNDEDGHIPQYDGAMITLEDHSDKDDEDDHIPKREEAMITPEDASKQKERCCKDDKKSILVNQNCDHSLSKFKGVFIGQYYNVNLPTKCKS